jgi:hypothetical protein
MHRAPLCNLSSGPLRVMSIQPAWWRYWTSLKNEGLWSEEPIPKIGVWYPILGHRDCLCVGYVFSCWDAFT